MEEKGQGNFTFFSTASLPVWILVSMAPAILRMDLSRVIKESWGEETREISTAISTVS